MPRARITERDRSKPHQIILNWADSNHNEIGVSCNCLRYGKYMGTVVPGESPWKLYLDPANHNNRPVPFNPTHRKTWRLFNA